jgi:DNA-binding transcriptional LysR family regulator
MMIPDPRRLLILRVVALKGSVSEAAELLNLTPSAISQQVAQLEREVGLPLLDRSQRPIGLTLAGKILILSADRIHDELETASSEISKMRGKISGPLRIGAFPTAIRHLIGPATEKICTANPEVSPIIVETLGAAALRDLRAGALDLIIIEQESTQEFPDYSDISMFVIGEEDFFIAVPQAWNGQVKSISDLFTRSWITGSQGTVSESALSTIESHYNFTANRVHYCVEYPTILSLIATGLGCAVIPHMAFQADLTAHLRIEIGFTCRRRLSALYLTKGSIDKTLLRSLLILIKEVFDSISD